MTRSIFISILSIFAFTIQGQDSLTYKSFFKKRDFGNYFYADRYAPYTNIGVGLMVVAEEYNLEPNPRLVAMVAEPVVGAQLPLYYFRNQKQRWSLSVPLSFSTWFDFTGNRTAPILNTDYRFAVIELNYSRLLKDYKINNIGFKCIPLFHESTHVGDELTINKITDTTSGARVNVSYETYELAIIANDPYNQKIKNHSVRIGAKFLWRPHKGYYTVDQVEAGKGVQIQPSTRWIEPYIQYQYQGPNCWLSNKRMMFVISSDFYLRVQYGYPFNYYDKNGNIVRADLKETYRLNVNTLVGWKFINAQNELSNMSMFLKLYLGMNPHGQFRNIPQYPWVGVNFIYDI